MSSIDTPANTEPGHSISPYVIEKAALRLKERLENAEMDDEFLLGVTNLLFSILIFFEERNKTESPDKVLKDEEREKLRSVFRFIDGIFRQNQEFARLLRCGYGSATKVYVLYTRAVVTLCENRCGEI